MRMRASASYTKCKCSGKKKPSGGYPEGLYYTKARMQALLNATRVMLAIVST